MACKGVPSLQGKSHKVNECLCCLAPRSVVNAACTLTFSTASAWINLYRNLGVDSLCDWRPAVPLVCRGLSCSGSVY